MLLYFDVFCTIVKFKIDEQYNNILIIDFYNNEYDKQIVIQIEFFEQLKYSYNFF